MADAVALHRMATDEFTRRVEAIKYGQWVLPTPCTDWDVRDLVRHLVYESLWTPPLFEGKTVAEVGDQFEGDIVGDDPLSAWMAASVNATAAVSASGAMDRIVHLSFGDFPGSNYAMQLTVDHAVHAWDLARGIGADEQLPEELAQACYDEVVPQMDMLAASGLFAKPVEIDDNASVQDKLLGLLGRDPRPAKE